MAHHMQNPGLQPGVSRDLLCLVFSLSPSTATDWQVQRIATCFAVTTATARRIASLHYGEAGHD
jgi:hypothetical protein